MPWKEHCEKSARRRLIEEVRFDHYSVCELCGRHQISRKTAYKWLKRFFEGGVEGLGNRSRRPRKLRGSALEPAWKQQILDLKKRHPHWDAKKLRARLGVVFADQKVPSSSTIQRLLRKANLVRPTRRRLPGPLWMQAWQQAQESNDVWSVDYKGWFRTGDGQACHVLTVSDLWSRYLLCTEAHARIDGERVRRCLERLFSAYGLPRAIRLDNGKPFGERSAPLGLTRLSVCWRLAGIELQFIDPGCPYQNGSHERMHRTLKAEVATPPARSLHSQNRRLQRWRMIFNQERPHEALGGRCPGDLYRPSQGWHQPLKDQPQYPPDWPRRSVGPKGDIWWEHRRRFIGRAFCGRRIGLKLIEAGCWEVYLGDLLLGHLREADLGGLRPTVLVHGSNKNLKSTRQLSSTD